MAAAGLVSSDGERNALIGFAPFSCEGEAVISDLLGVGLLSSCTLSAQF